MKASQEMLENQYRAASLQPKETQGGAAEQKARIRTLIDIYYDTQDVRIRTFNRLRTAGKVEGINPNLLKELEKEIREYIHTELKDLPLYAWLRGVKGIGPILAGGLISHIDIAKADHASSLWKFFGLHVKEGKAVRRRKGEKLDFNIKMRTLAWKIADSFIKRKTPFYTDIYYEAKKLESEKLRNCAMRKECLRMLSGRARRVGTAPKQPPCKLHAHYRAVRKMVKRFLLDLWVHWRNLEGLPVSQPYAIAILGHQPSQSRVENQGGEASQVSAESQSRIASHSSGENQSVGASHKILENQGSGASQTLIENQRGAASHIKIENHFAKASSREVRKPLQGASH